MEEFNENKRIWEYCFRFTNVTTKGSKLLNRNGFTSFDDVRKLYQEKERRKLSRTSLPEDCVIINGKAIKCKFCNSTNIKEISVQMRSTDEGETQLIYCNVCIKRYVMD
jgi:DNA-directed RNA polymerase subunit M/transcription elongation factor TFIIS